MSASDAMARHFAEHPDCCDNGKQGMCSVGRALYDEYLNSDDARGLQGLAADLRRMDAETVQACRVCGCTEADACLLGPDGAKQLFDVIEADETLPAGYTTCSWVEPDLCSGCVADKVPPLLVDGQGNPLRGAP